MFLLQLLKWLLLVIEALIFIPVAYLCILAVSATVETKRRRKAASFSPVPPVPRTRFAILIPAHNEEAMIQELLNSLAALTYPKDLYSVYVVADNCTDSTAELVRATGWVHVYERFDKIRRGKGYALHWLLQQLEENQLIYDAYIIFDADSVVAADFLQVMDRALAQDVSALQGWYTVLNGSEAPSTALRWMALTLINHIRPLGRSAIGSSSTLTGNGMCFTRSLLMRCPWQAFSTTEDYQYYLTLVQHGVRVRYVPEAIVRSHMPTTFAQMRTQDVRWEGSEPGHVQWSTAWNLLKTGLRLGDFVRVEAVAELLTPPLSQLVCTSLLLLLVSLLLRLIPQLLFSLLLVGGLVYYISTPLYLLRPPPGLYKVLFYAPAFVAWKLWVYIVLRKSKKYAGKWIPTSRPISTK